LESCSGKHLKEEIYMEVGLYELSIEDEECVKILKIYGAANQHNYNYKSRLLHTASEALKQFSWK